MNKLVICLVVLCAVFYQYVDAKHKCKEDFKKMKKAMEEVIEEGNAPECFNEYELSRFNCTGGEDEEKDKEKRKEFKEYLKGLEEEDQKNVLQCLGKMGEMAMEKVGDEISNECKEKMKKMQEKMSGGGGEEEES
ncbi:uncharacterized protein TNCT_405361 [Trichonephila clavata]|uniref:Uncharacterized protein n=1 Tax=Trichonephila clavata TaxID=2740835 RepID=A0A8X6GNF4_TRICU|nr:uncharacterized protein TNCT_405361 [Trichonephila clavata]